jgi:uncharacterized membrane protein HdeD (DUF308 family)
MPFHAGGRKGLHAAAARSSSGRRSWPYALYLLAIPVLVLVGILASSHPATSALHVAFYLAVVAVLLVCQGYAVYRSSRRTSPRPRWQYFLFCAGYLVVGIVTLAFAGWADDRHIGWLSGALACLSGLSFAGALVMFGRGAFPGRLRRSFWRFPPPWLDQGQRRSTSALPRRKGSLSDPDSTAPPLTAASQDMGDGHAQENEDRNMQDLAAQRDSRPRQPDG